MTASALPADVRRTAEVLAQIRVSLASTGDAVRTENQNALSGQAQRVRSEAVDGRHHPTKTED